MYWRYLLRRVLTLIVNGWIITTLIFFMFRFLPGDPTAMFLDPSMAVEVRMAILERFGLDRPLHEQYLLYMQNLFRGDFGWSFYYNRPVGEIIGQFLPNTIILAIASLVIAYVGGVIGGVILAWKRNSRFGEWGTLIPLFFRSAPVFWTGMVAVMFLSYRWGLFPHRGMRTAGYVADNFLEKFLSLDFLHHLALPTLVAALYYMGLPMLLTRTSMLEVFGEEFVDLARARGFSEPRVMFVHVLRNALLPIVTATAVAVGLAVGGNIVIEYVFSWPGIGREIVLATQNRDYPLAQGMFIVIAAAVMVANMLADMVYVYLDPRVTLR